MAHSGIHFGGKAIFEKDWNIGEFIKAMGISFVPYLDDGGAVVEWFPEACSYWMEDHRNSAPGVRDLELDEYLTNSGRAAQFSGYLQWLAKRNSLGEYDAPAVTATIQRVLELLGVEVDGQ